MATAGEEVRSKVIGLPSAWCCQIAVMSQLWIWLLNSGDGVGIMRGSMKLYASMLCVGVKSTLLWNAAAELLLLDGVIGIP